MDTRAKQSLFDNLGRNEELVARLDAAVRNTKKADWKSNRFKLREVQNAVTQELGGEYADDLLNVRS